MSSAIAIRIGNYLPLIEHSIEARLPVSRLGGAERLNEALRYAVIPGGKRMRPILAILAAEMCGAPAASALPVACALEFLHVASLIFDDLPSMDDAFFRHSRACLHLEFGEATAILAGLALMNQAYALFAGTPALLARAAAEIGVGGMIGGQAADVAGSRSRGRLEKTTALTRLTMLAGGYVGDAAPADLAALAYFGEAVGEAYQICDDVADRSGPDADQGKTAGQDSRHDRCSFVDELGEEACKTRAHLLIDTACERLNRRFAMTPEAKLLEQFARSIPARAFGERTNAAHHPDRAAYAGRVERDLLAGSFQPQGT